MPLRFVIILEQKTLQKQTSLHAYLRMRPLDLTVCLTRIVADEQLSQTDTDQLEALCLQKQIII